MTENDLPRRTRCSVLTVVASAVALVCFGAFGGAGFANSSIGAKQYEDGGKKVTICHKGKKTIRISRSALPAHLAHGDKAGACEDKRKQEQRKRAEAEKREQAEEREKRENAEKAEKAAKGERPDEARSAAPEQGDKPEKADKAGENGGGNGKGKGKG